MAEFAFTYQRVESRADLNEKDISLLKEAMETARGAHAPYSGFLVGAAIRLENGKTVHGANQENASYPLGLCAERVAMAAAVSVYPNVPIVAMAISYRNLNGPSNRPITPCGICRQAIVEYESKWNLKIPLILGGESGSVWIIHSAKDLLPLGFSAEDMRAKD